MANAHETSQPKEPLAAEVIQPRLWPSWLVSLWILFAIVMVVLLRFARHVFQAEIIDTAVVNLLTYVLSISSVLALWFWFTWRSTHPFMLRRVFYFGGLAIVALLLACIRINGFTGDMVPTGFRLAWQKPADFHRAKPSVATTAIVVDEPLDAPAVQPKKETNDKSTEGEQATKLIRTSRITDLIQPTPDDFPQFLGPNRDGVLNRVALATDWQTNLPELLWEQPVGAGWSAFSVVGNRVLTMEQYGNEELVTCRDLETGDLLWSHVEQTRHENVLGGVGPRATPTIHDNHVYTVGGTGVVLCLALQDGKLIWRDELQQRYFARESNPQQTEEKTVAWGRSGSALIYKDLCIIPAGGLAGKEKSLIAYDKQTGEVKWEGGHTQISYASPAVLRLLGSDHIVSVNESTVTGHAPETGKVLWTYPWPGESNSAANCSQPHRHSDNTFFISKGYGVGAALVELKPKESVGDGEEKYETRTVWSNKKVLKTKFTNVVVLYGFIYGLNDGILECVDAQTGQSKWKKGRYGNGQILAVKDHILVLSERSGEVALVAADATEYRELCRFQALTSSSQAWNNLCLVGNKLLVRNADQAVCFELPLKK